MKNFYSIKEDRRFETKIKRSVFICSLRYVESVFEAKQFITEVSSSHKQATHNCWAYIVGDNGEMSHFSDHGEPSGTAGKPILNTLESYDMTNISAVVTRYFGGVKLGIKGLINAYRDTVKQAIESERLVKLVQTTIWHIEVPYAFNDTLVYRLKKFKGEIKNTEYTDVVKHIFEVEESDRMRFEVFLQEYEKAGRLSFHKF